MSKQPSRPQRPLPNYASPYQPGISDPQWPVETPPYLKKKEHIDRYVADQAGRPDAQDWLIAIFLDINVKDREGLRDLLKDLSRYASEEMAMSPGKSDLEIWQPAPRSRRVTITIGFGHSLFMSRYGDDRFTSATKNPNGCERCKRPN